MEKIWVHTPSVGEFNTVKPLLEILKERHPLTLSFSSPRAVDFMKKQNLTKSVYHLFPPLGFKVKELLKKERPKYFFLVESDRFPSLLNANVEYKFIINARLSDKSFKFLQLFKFFYSKWFNSFNEILCKDEETCEKFLQLGVNKTKLTACGNLKLVFNLQNVNEVVKFPERSFVIVLGSTHKGEEEVWLKAFKEIKRVIPSAVLVVAPRHVSRAEEILKLAKSLFPNLSVKRRSEVGSTFKGDILIVDTLGELLGFYKRANVAFVGGSLVKVGGHNLLEPAYFSKPTLFGPYVYKFRDLESFLTKLGLGFKVKGKDDIVKTVTDLYKNPLKVKVDFRGFSQKVLGCYLKRLGNYLKL